jgi:hypothetical protein
MSLELTTCPECGAPAEVIRRFVLSSTDGPIEHVKTRCVTGPWFTSPATVIARGRVDGGVAVLDISDKPSYTHRNVGGYP